MKAVEIVNYVMEQRALRKQSNNVSVGDREPVPNRPLKKRRKPINGPVLMTFSWPHREILMGDAEASEK
ncbi:hypothetical protein B9Z35_12755 [Limnohabitans sp. Jir61]|nr:hypothetical protein B9Z35_12755 [Limnohabitans sp. Jir61]